MIKKNFRYSKPYKYAVSECPLCGASMMTRPLGLGTFEEICPKCYPELIEGFKNQKEVSA